MVTFQALSFSSFFRHDCGVNISCRPHVLQVDLFLKIYSSIWLSQNFLGYNSILFISTLRFVQAGRSFFCAPTPGRVRDLGNGLELWEGIFQSAVIGWHPFLNVDGMWSDL
jgi:hypothetical protein